MRIERERDRSASVGDVIEQRTTPRRQATDERQFGELHSFVWGLGGYVGLSPYSPYGAIPLPLTITPTLFNRRPHKPYNPHTLERSAEFPWGYVGAVGLVSISSPILGLAARVVVRPGSRLVVLSRVTDGRRVVLSRCRSARSPLVG